MTITGALNLDDCIISPVVLGIHPPSFLVAPQAQDFLCYPEVRADEQSKYGEGDRKKYNTVLTKYILVLRSCSTC